MIDLKTPRIRNSKTQEEIAKYLGISRQAYCNYELGRRQPDLEVLLKLAELYGVTVDSIVRPDDSARPGVLYETSADADAVARAYSELQTIAEKDMIRRALGLDSISLAEKARIQTKIIPLLGTAAAAGPGEPDTGLAWEDYEVPEDSAAEFAIRISGDSMEPVLIDGKIAFCEKRKPNVGDLSVMMVNGSLLVKQFIRDNYGNIYLRSLNRARKDCDYNIRASGNDTVMCFGVVITKGKIPLVEA